MRSSSFAVFDPARDPSIDAQLVWVDGVVAEVAFVWFGHGWQHSARSGGYTLRVAKSCEGQFGNVTNFIAD